MAKSKTKKEIKKHQSQDWNNHLCRGCKRLKTPPRLVGFTP